MAAAASGEWQETWAQSETLRWMAAYSVELMVAINNEVAGLSAFERGKLEGRIALEVALIVVPLTKAAQAAQVSKAAVLDDLTKVGWIQQDQPVLNAINKVKQLAEGAKPPPLIKDLTAEGNPLVLTKRFPTIPASALVVDGDIGRVPERILGSVRMKIAQGKSRRVAFLEAMEELPSNAGDVRLIERLRQVVDAELRELPDLPANATPPQVEEWLTTLGAKFDDLWIRGEYEDLLSVKGLQAADGVVVPGGAGDLRGHHIVPEDIIEELGRWINGLEERGSPLKVFTHPQHYGQGPNSLHNRMYRLYDASGNVVGKTRLHPDRLGEFGNPAEMMDTLLRFYDSYPEYADLAKATRAYCMKKLIPFTRRNPFDPVVPPWPQQ